MLRILAIAALVLGVVYAGEDQEHERRQEPGVWDALADLRGRDLTTEEIQDILNNAIPDKDFPILTEIPDDSDIDCNKFHQPGFYADEKHRCQVFHRCDVNGNLKTFLCPVMTVFNQITIVCDWFYNVECGKSSKYVDYSNSRLYTSGHLLDDQDEVSTGAIRSKMEAPLAENMNTTAPAKGKRKGRKHRKPIQAGSPSTSS